MTIRNRINPRTDGMEDFREFDPDEGEIGRRTIETTDGQTFTTKSFDPYGLVKIEVSKGKLPEQLKGVFTSHFEADKAIEAYLATKKKG